MQKMMRILIVNFRQSVIRLLLHNKNNRKNDIFIFCILDQIVLYKIWLYIYHNNEYKE